MKSNKKFPPELRSVVGQAFKDYSAWMRETVQGITCEAIEKRGLSQEDIEGCICLTLDEAKYIFDALNHALDKAESVDDMLFYRKRIHFLKDKIKQTKDYLPIHGTPMEGKLILPKQAEGK